MAGEPSDFGSGVALDAITGRATQTARTTYIALLSAAPTDTTTNATMTEITTSGYARQSCAFSAPSAAETHNTSLITFGPFTADPPNITHAALVSSSSGTTGDFLYWWSLSTARDPATNDSLTLAATTGVSITID